MSDRAPVAVVAGGSGALGRAVVRRLLDDGWRVAALGRSGAVDRVAEGAEGIRCDLSEPAQVDALPERIAALGAWRACVVCSGGFAMGRAHEITETDMSAQLELNLLGPWRIAQVAARSMLRGGAGGRIVLTLSRAGVEVVARQAAYQLTKAAAARLVQVMALELVDSGITVNGVLPSTMDTAANRAAMGEARAATWVKVDSVAAVIAWLCSDEAAEVSGALVPAYGRA